MGGLHAPGRDLFLRLKVGLMVGPVRCQAADSSFLLTLSPRLFSRVFAFAISPNLVRTHHEYNDHQKGRTKVLA